jgi:hypothetical protein
VAYEILQSSTQSVLLFLMVQSADHISPLTGATTTVTLSKNGGAFAAPAGAVSEIGNGWYKVAGNATDTNTLGPLALHATAASGDPCDIIVANVVAYNPQNATLGITTLTSVGSVTGNVGGSVGSVTGNVGGNVVGSVGSVTGAVGSVTGSVASVTGAVGSVTGSIGGSVVGSVASVTNPVTVGTNSDKTGYTLIQAFPTNFSSLSIDATGKVSLQSPTALKKNTALASFMFVMYDSTTHQPATGLTVTATRSLNAAPFAACANLPVEVANGVYSLSLAATDTNADVIAFLFNAVGADQTTIIAVTNA